jgi:ABC-type glycerol-3-phosphate transport system substrate-binding protein
MKRFRRTASVCAALGLAAALSAACSGGDGSGDSDQTTLKIWDFSAEQVDFHKTVAAAYNKENPKVKIDWRVITQDEYTKTLPLAFQSKQGPDVFYWSDGGPMAMSQLQSFGWIKPLTTDGNVPDDFKSRFPDGSFIDGINQSGGKTYGFPFSESTYWGAGYMFMNKAVFEKAGLDVNTPPKTWSDLKAACAKIIATKVNCIAAPTKGRSQWQRLFGAISAGTQTDGGFNYKDGHYALNDPKMLDAFKFLQELKNAKYFAPGTNDQNFSRQQLAAGQAGIYFDGTWMPSVWKAQGFTSDKFAVAPHVNPDSGPTGSLQRQYDGNKYWVSAQTKNGEAAWNFLNWMTKPDGTFVQEYFKGGFGTLAFADNQKYVTDPAVKKIMEIASVPGFRATTPVPLLKCPELAKSKAWTSASTKNQDAEYNAMMEALNGNKDLSPLASKVVAERQKLLEDGLKKEADSGLKVSMDCYTFPDFSFTQDYTLDKYKK